VPPWTAGVEAATIKRVTKGTDSQMADLSSDVARSQRFADGATLPVEANDRASHKVSARSDHGPHELRATSGARAVLSELMETHGDKIYSLCVRMLRDREQAKDVLQQVFLEAHRDLERFEGRAAPSSWLYSIAINRCKDAMKAARRRLQRIQVDGEVVEAFEDPAASPAATVEHRRLLSDLALCVGELASAVRVAVLLHYQVGMSYEEMSSVLDTNADTLQTRVRRALKPLKRCLGGKGWTGV
jgi:RNA polymerase sigma-70 factor, ECF subfamily